MKAAETCVRPLQETEADPDGAPGGADAQPGADGGRGRR